MTRGLKRDKIRIGQSGGKKKRKLKRSERSSNRRYFSARAGINQRMARGSFPGYFLFSIGY
jgi:hypothetical protein